MLSFIVPIYNKKPEQVTKCLDSLLGNSYKDIEIICVFDGENKELQEVVAEKMYKKVKRQRKGILKWFYDKFPKYDEPEVVCNPISMHVIQHGGAPAARNAGVKEAKGEYVCFFDADTYAQPEMIQEWIDGFKTSGCDFVYGGYAFTTNDHPPFQSNNFDPWLLEKYNYIASSFPLKREFVVEWDESLKGLQDWDFWRRVVRKGAKGHFIRPPWYAWLTDMPVKTDISGANSQSRVERIKIVRKKYKDKKGDMLFSGAKYLNKAIELAKLFNADVFNGEYWAIDSYKLLYSLGLDNEDGNVSTWSHSLKTSDSVQVLHWTKGDVIRFCGLPHIYALDSIKNINKEKIIHLADDIETEKLLDDIGIRSHYVPIPSDTSMLSTELPEKFKVLVRADESSEKDMIGIRRALPQIEMDFIHPGVPVDIREYSLYVSFTLDRKIDEAMKRALAHGRWVISNIQAPYAGNVTRPNKDYNFKKKVIDLIIKTRERDRINNKAQDYYKELFSQKRFIDTINDIVKKGYNWEGK